MDASPQFSSEISPWFPECLSKGCLWTQQSLEVGEKGQVLGIGCSCCYQLQQKCLPVPCQVSMGTSRRKKWCLEHSIFADILPLNCLMTEGLQDFTCLGITTQGVGQQPLSIRDAAAAPTLPLRATCAAARRQEGYTLTRGTYLSLVSWRKCEEQLLCFSRDVSFMSPLEAKLGWLHISTWAASGRRWVRRVFLFYSEIVSSAESINN